MITTYFQSSTVILWCLTQDAPRYRLATAVNYDDMAVYSPIQFGGL